MEKGAELQAVILNPKIIGQQSAVTKNKSIQQVAELVL